MLVLEHHPGLPALHGRKVRTLDDHLGIGNSPRVVVEEPAQHLAVFGPVHRSGGCGVHADEAVACLDPVQQILLLIIGEVGIAIGVEQHGVEIVEVLAARLIGPALGIAALAPGFLLRDPVGIGADEGDISARLPPDLLDHRDGMAHRHVGGLVAGRKVGNHQQALLAGIGILIARRRHARRSGGSRRRRGLPHRQQSRERSEDLGKLHRAASLGRA